MRPIFSRFALAVAFAPSLLLATSQPSTAQQPDFTIVEVAARADVSGDAGFVVVRNGGTASGILTRLFCAVQIGAGFSQETQRPNLLIPAGGRREFRFARAGRVGAVCCAEGITATRAPEIHTDNNCRQNLPLAEDVFLHVDRVRSLVGGEGLCGSQDFFAVVTIKDTATGRTLAHKRFSTIFGRNDITPHWGLQTTIGNRPASVDAEIELKENDAWGCSTDDRFDINPAGGIATLPLRLDLARNRVFRVNPGAAPVDIGSAGVQIVQAGAHGGQNAEIRFRFGRGGAHAH